MKDLKKTPLYPMYQKYQAKVIDFGGWALPVQFDGIKKEHHVTRNAVGLFDVSHMGEIIVTGEGSLSFLQQMCTNDVSLIKPNKAQYTFMCYPNGGTVDDLIIYQLDNQKYLLVVNAANHEKDLDWLLKHKSDNVEITDQSHHYVQLALQGPKAENVLQKITKQNVSDIRFFSFKQDVVLEGIEDRALVARTGYTGEDGFEIYIPLSSGMSLWEKLLEVGEADGIFPIGLGARDTLRFEASLPLYGHELSAEITPIEAGLGFAVKTNKESDFIGKEVLQQQKQQGVTRKLVGIEMIDKGIPRHEYPIYDKDTSIGFVTSGTNAPTLAKNLGLALIDSNYAKEGTIVTIKIRNKYLQAKVISTPFYKRN
ncbi:Aminomethyltransferase [Paraliobacillus sp. PM-2]|uniref:glycine cleavage system aminomethyltransferase GcvT n=1 Tax=Paraliobacillus sp. PM-2 TaxID=1462524 RepID=UPI00061C2FCE|nr:glycine cleavage system aminomethyltransferase GcvT [Paraliobacillus sp. PM-2]CQR46828.1 Aminomethyltransferase [Paraliobacillus sp. PM-2]